MVRHDFDTRFEFYEDLNKKHWIKRKERERVGGRETERESERVSQNEGERDPERERVGGRETERERGRE